LKTALIDKIKSKTANVTVIGLGNVGLPTAAMFAEAGFDVTGADVNEKVTKAVNEGRSEMKEAGLDELIGKVVKQGKLKATLNVLQAVKEGDIIIICVQTPLTKEKVPNLTFLEKASKTVAQGLLRDKLVIVGSTVPPRTTEKRVANILETGSGLRCGVNFWLAHCPERITRGKALQEIVQTARIVGGYDVESSRIAVELFKAVSKGKIVVTDCTSAEVAKLAENTYRTVNIALANELALICRLVGIDVIETIRLANTHPRVNIHKPGCGVGGPCLPKDPYLLLSAVEEEKFESRIIQPACELNDYMPEHTVELVSNALKRVGKEVKNSKVAVLGATFKGEVESVANSPSEAIVHKLMTLGAKVVVYDPYSEESFGAQRAKDVDEAVRETDCVVIATDHKLFRELELEKIKALMNEEPALIDGRRVVHPIEAQKQGFTYLGIGHS